MNFLFYLSPNSYSLNIAGLGPVTTWILVILVLLLIALITTIIKYRYCPAFTTSIYCYILNIQRISSIILNRHLPNFHTFGA